MTVKINISEFNIGIRPCPLCDGIEFSPIAHQDRNLLGITTVGCKRCGLVQTNPRPSPAGLELFYRDHYRLFYQGATAPDQAYIASLNKDVRLAYTVKFFSDQIKIASNAIVLDFGCGEGSLFAALRKADFTGAFYGVELNASFGDYASRYGNATVSNTIRSPEPVDLAVINHVLEHIDDPIGILRKISKLIKPGGYLYIDVPDAEEYTGIQDLHFAHLYHFSERTLAQLISRAGYKIRHVEKHSPPNHPLSIRLVAQYDLDIAELPLGGPTNEAKVWRSVEKSAGFFKILRLRLRDIRMLRYIYRTARSVIGL